MSIDFDTSNRTAMVRDVVRKLRDVKPADPKEPPPPLPVLNMHPRRHDVVRWDQNGYVTKSEHATKELALEYAHNLHWATTWKWSVLCGRELIERRELEQPADYDEQVRRFFMSRNGIA